MYILRTKGEVLIVQFTLLAIFITIGIFVVLYLKKQYKNPPKLTSDEILVKFSKMYSDGKITKEEYRSIKLQLANDLTGKSFEQLQNGIKIKKKAEIKMKAIPEAKKDV